MGIHPELCDPQLCCNKPVVNPQGFGAEALGGTWSLPRSWTRLVPPPGKTLGSMGSAAGVPHRDKHSVLESKGDQQKQPRDLPTQGPDPGDGGSFAREGISHQLPAASQAGHERGVRPRLPACSS